jgi:adiponectin receptor
MVSTYCYLYMSMGYEPPFVGMLRGGDLVEHDIPLHSIQFFWGTAIYLFAMSTIYHTFFCVNEKYSRYLLRLDYSGICLIASGGTIPIIDYGLSCRPTLMRAYVVLNLCMSLSVGALSLMDFVHE